MARDLNMVVFMAIFAAAAMLHGSQAQTTHVVGDVLGWLVPPGGDLAYTTWASLKTFTVGDILVFNYTTGFHNVAEVTKEAFDSCNTTSQATSPYPPMPQPTLHYVLLESITICAPFPGIVVWVENWPSMSLHLPSFHQQPRRRLRPASAATPSSATPPASSAPVPSSSVARPPSSSIGPTAPTNPSTPSPTPHPPGNSAPIFAIVVALPVTFLSISLALLY